MSANCEQFNIHSQLTSLTDTSAAIQDGNDKLPANIQHYYGTEVCRALFGDSIPPAVPRSKSPPTCQCRDQINGDATTSAGERLVLDPTAPNFQYESLGRILRSNVINGTNVVYQRSVTHDDFRSSVYDGSRAWLHGRTGKAAPDDHRYRKDELSTRSFLYCIMTVKRWTFNTELSY